MLTSKRNLNQREGSFLLLSMVKYKIGEKSSKEWLYSCVG